MISGGELGGEGCCADSVSVIMPGLHRWQLRADLGGGGALACSQNVLRPCLERMKAWVLLATHVVRAEFPEFEAVSAMHVFDLGKDVEIKSGLDLPADVHCALVRLASTFNLPTMDVITQWRDFRPRAHHHYCRSHTSNANAWRTAIEETQTRPETAAKHPKAILVGCLHRMSGFAPHSDSTRLGHFGSG